MRLLVFQHIRCEHPGSLRQFLAEDGVEWDAIELDQGAPIPDLEGYDALWVMGGPMDVWEVEEHPWLALEKRAICQWVLELQRPYLGLCLGHQLLADALGGACAPMQEPEVGVLDVTLTDAGLEDPIFRGMPRQQKCLQWHSVGVTQLPEDALVLAESPACPIQAMRFGESAWSMQYHVEVEPDTIDNWGEVPAYRTSLEVSHGLNALNDMRTQAAAEMNTFVTNCRQLYRNFRTAANI